MHVHIWESVISLPRIRLAEASTRTQAFRYHGKGHPAIQVALLQKALALYHRPALPVQADKLFDEGSQITGLPQLPLFGNKGQDDGDSYDR